MNTFESGVKRRDRKFPISSPASAAFPRRGAKLTGFCETLHGKVAPSGPGDCGPGGRVDPSAGPGCPFPAKQAASEPPRFALPLLTTLSAACPLAPTPKGTRQIDRTASPLSPILQQMRNGRRSHPPRPRADRSQARQCTRPPPSCAPRPKKWRNSRNPSASSQTRHLLTILRPAQIYEPLLAYMNKQALAHEFSYANLYSQNIRRFARKTSMHEVKRLLAFNARPRRSNRCRS